MISCVYCLHEIVKLFSNPNYNVSRNSYTSFNFTIRFIGIYYIGKSKEGLYCTLANSFHMGMNS